MDTMGTSISSSMRDLHDVGKGGNVKGGMIGRPEGHDGSSRLWDCYVMTEARSWMCDEDNASYVVVRARFNCGTRLPSKPYTCCKWAYWFMICNFGLDKFICCTWQLHSFPCLTNCMELKLSPSDNIWSVDQVMMGFCIVPFLEAPFLESLLWSLGVVIGVGLGSIAGSVWSCWRLLSSFLSFWMLHPWCHD
jgi:hypothetical protein